MRTQFSSKTTPFSIADILTKPTGTTPATPGATANVVKCSRQPDELIRAFDLSRVVSRKSSMRLREESSVLVGSSSDRPSTDTNDHSEDDDEDDDEEEDDDDYDRESESDDVDEDESDEFVADRDQLLPTDEATADSVNQ